MTYLYRSQHKSSLRSVFFRGVHYILAGGIAGIAVGGVIAPALHLNITETYALLSSAIGALTALVIKAFKF